MRSTLSRFFPLWLPVLFLSFTASSQVPGLLVNGLTCENRRDPVGMDESRPLLGWQLQPATKQSRGLYQSAYQVQVATTKSLLESGRPDTWDSRRQSGRQNHQVVYGGRRLVSGKQYWWRVKVWDGQGRASAWSRPASWTMGLLAAADWKGQWIQDPQPRPVADSLLYTDLPAPLFRKEFRLKAKPSRAILHVSGLGYYEAYLNGRKIGNQVLDPGQTDYSKRVLYSSYDIAHLLSADNNCLGVQLGNGWYQPLPLRMWGRFDLREALSTGTPKFLLQLDLEYPDGSRQSVSSDGTWKVYEGPITRNNIYLGEHIDHRRLQKGWNTPGFNDQAWRRAVPAPSPGGQLQAQFQPPIVIRDSLRPASIHRLPDGRFIVDFGRNFGGTIRLLARAGAGTTIRVRLGELLYPDGSLNVMTSTAGQVKRRGMGGPGAPDTAYQYHQFTCAGTGEESFQPIFTYHGFRYAEISGYPGTLGEKDITGLAMAADVREAGYFSASEQVLNDIQQLCRNTFLSNLFSVQSDCPHREKFGYGGDIVGVHEAFLHNFDMHGFYAKTVLDFADAARPDGGLTETAPYVGIADAGLGNGSGPIEWGSVHPVLLYRLYQYYGDRRLVERQYPVAKKWVDYLRGKARDHIIDITLGDHESIDPKDIAVSGTSFYYYNIHLLSRLAKILGRQADQEQYDRLAEEVKQAFIAKFLDPVSGKVGLGTASTQAHALYFGLVPEKSLPAVLGRLVSEVSETHKGHVSTGIFGTKYVPEVLSRYGYSELAYGLITRPGFPGWVHMLEKGATTLWEHWEYSDNTYSHNHPMFGVVSEWLYRHLAGIRPAEDAAGFDRILIRPAFDLVPRLEAGYRSIHGLVSSGWSRENGRLSWELNIPPNTTAEIHLPGIKLSSITENGVPLPAAAGVEIIGQGEGGLHLRVGSGTYRFQVSGKH